MEHVRKQQTSFMIGFAKQLSCWVCCWLDLKLAEITWVLRFKTARVLALRSFVLMKISSSTQKHIKIRILSPSSFWPSFDVSFWKATLGDSIAGCQLLSNWVLIKNILQLVAIAEHSWTLSTNQNRKCSSYEHSLNRWMGTMGRTFLSIIKLSRKTCNYTEKPISTVADLEWGFLIKFQNH